MNMARTLLSVAVLAGVGVAARAQHGADSSAPGALQEIAQVEAEIDRIEAATLARLEAAGLSPHGANAEGRATFTFARIVPPW